MLRSALVLEQAQQVLLEYLQAAGVLQDKSTTRTSSGTAVLQYCRVMYQSYDTAVHQS